MYLREVPPDTAFYHGTKADLAVGDLLGSGLGSNFVKRSMKHAYFGAAPRTAA